MLCGRHYSFPLHTMLYKIIHPVYRIEAKNKAEALAKAKKAIAAGEIRVCEAEGHQNLASLFFFGPK